MKEYKIIEFQFNEIKEHLENYKKLKLLTYNICDICDNMIDDENELISRWELPFLIDREEYDYDIRNFKFLIDDIEAANE